MNRLLCIFITTIVLACACQDAGNNAGDGDAQACCAAVPVCAPGKETFQTLEACEATAGECTANSECCSTVYCPSDDRPSGDGVTTDQDAGDSTGDGDAQVCCAAAAVCAPGEETFHTLEACEATGGKCTKNSVCCSTVYCRSGDRPSGDGGIIDQNGDDGAGYDIPPVTCAAVPGCELNEERYWSLEACEAAGGECTTNSACDVTVYCRFSDCEGTIISSIWGCQSGDYCRPLSSGEYCTGHHDGCSEWSWPITLQEDGACPEGLYCDSELPDGRWCVYYEFESVNDCMNMGDYATPPIGAIVPCNPGDTALGFVTEFEDPSLCCLDTTPIELSCQPDAEPVGDCEMFLGWGWDGEVCEAWSGCRCRGPGCEALYDSKEECNEAQQARGCLPPDCLATDCDPSRPSCEANATPVGDCEMFLGWGWDGEVCGAWSGCSCAGEGCHDLYNSKEECNEAQQARGCLPPDCRITGCDEGYICDANCWSDYMCVPEDTGASGNAHPE